MSKEHVIHVTQASTLLDHLHGGPTLARGRAAADPDGLPTTYVLDVRELLKVTVETGFTIVPWRDGEPRAFVLLATRLVREWVEARIDIGQPLWLLPAPAAREALAVEGPADA